jgi:adenylate kinase family enzyme
VPASDDDVDRKLAVEAFVVMDRIVLVGNSGAGKTSMARILAERLGLRHSELDAIFHQPGWTALDEVDFRARVSALVDEPRWVIDGNYETVRGITWARADTVIWLDLPRWLVMRRIVWRSARRVLGRQVLWNGNRESLRNSLSWNPERSVVRWAWVSHARTRERYVGAMGDPTFSHLTFVRLRSDAAIRAFVDTLGSTAGR